MNSVMRIEILDHVLRAGGRVSVSRETCVSREVRRDSRGARDPALPALRTLLPRESGNLGVGPRDVFFFIL